MILGSAISFIRKPPDGGLQAEFIVNHPIEQADLTYWKVGEINRLFDAVQKDYSQNKAGFSITRGKRIRVIHTWFHRKGKKAITDKIRFMDHPVGMAMLLCDKGSVNDGLFITIAVPYFSEKELLRFLNHIKINCGAEGCIVSGDREQQIKFDPENSKIVWNYAEPWIPKVASMLEKFSALSWINPKSQIPNSK
ncbi:MAG: hypothetical protein GY749_17295 [Desulfobacteraceae bacterium]|nr:hypothetical protein [Desulfobacteraceae bacterium]